MQIPAKSTAAVPALLLLAGLTAAQTPASSNLVVPQSRVWRCGQPAAVRVTSVDVGVVITGQVAVTTMDVLLENPSGRRLEAEILVPVPAGAAIKGVDFQGAAAEPTARLLPVDEARRTYGAIVARLRDPALLEFTGHGLVRTSVFPVEARSQQRVRLTWEQVLRADAGRIDYVLPRSESLEHALPLTVHVSIEAARPVSTVYSPSHEVSVRRRSAKAVAVKLARESAAEPGPFHLSYLLEKGDVSASLYAYPETDGGYFLLLAGLPARAPAPETAVKREVTIVLDRSGSMRGEKLEQAREAALQIIAGLDLCERFNVVLYNDGIERFAATSVEKHPDTLERVQRYLGAVQAGGGTNLHDALAACLEPAPPSGCLPLVIFLTDGLPTVGERSETAIRDLAEKRNPHERRVFTFGVGHDVNTHLLESIAYASRAQPTFVLPKEDVEVKVASVFRRLKGPVLTAPKLAAVAGPQGVSRISDVVPSELPDLFEGDQLVVIGRYRGKEPLAFELEGVWRGKERRFAFTFDLDRATTRNAFVRRLWASRRIATLVDEIRRMGADSGAVAAAAAAARPGAAARPPATAPEDPRLAELVGEVVRLSTEHGVLTEYTAFLAEEGTDLSERDAVMEKARNNFVSRAWACRSGRGSVNQSVSNCALMNQTHLNRSNAYWDAGMNRVSVTRVQQIGDLAFYRRGERWIDARLCDEEQSPEPRIVRFGSPEFDALVGRLARDGRQGCVALTGDILLQVDGKPVLVKAPARGTL